MNLGYFRQFGATKPGEVTWSHAVNGREKLARFLDNPAAMVIESDIRLSKSGVAVAAHPPETESDLTFDELIGAIRKSKQGLKIDFKDPEALTGCLRKLGENPLPQPIFLNADILQGNGADPSKFNAAEFIALSKKYYPAGILSLGWTTIADPAKGYTRTNIDQMLGLCEGLREVTFPVRACLLPGSWNEAGRLVAKNGRTLTVWNSKPVDAELKEWIENNTDPEKTFYDVIDEKNDPLRI